MVEIRFDKNFKRIFSKIKDASLREKIQKQIKKISNNPETGKPMKNIRKNTREVYIKPFRLSYKYFSKENIIYVLDLFHKKYQ